MSRATRRRAFTPLDWLIVRAPLLPIEVFEGLRDDRAGALAEDDPLATAIELASPDLAARLRGAPGEDRAARDAAVRYAIRMSTRPTPFGLFAGVALARFGRETRLRLDGTIGTRTRPDGAWLTQLVRQLETRPEVRRHLDVVANPTAWIHEGRVRIADLGGSGPPQDAVSIRETRVVAAALRAARSPIRWNDLTHRVHTLTAAPPEAVERSLDLLFDNRVLVADVLPSPADTSPARYALERLTRIPGAHESVRALRNMLEAMRVLDAESSPLAKRDVDPVRQLAAAVPASPATGAGARLSVTGEAGQDDCLQLDTRLGLLHPEVASRVGYDAAELATVLLRLGPPPRPLDGFRQAFVARYGAEREVPLLEVLDETVGLGPHDRYGDTTSRGDLAAWARRESLLAELAAEALAEHRLHVSLSETNIAELAAAPLEPGAVPTSIDLSVYVLATSIEAIDHGNYQLLVGPNLGGQAAGRNLGRFADLIGDEAFTALRSLAEQEVEREPDVVHAELTYLPRRSRSVNVAIRPHGYRFEIALSTVTPSGTTAIPPSELVVRVRDGAVEVRWPAADVAVHVHAGHMLSRREAPPLAAFLEDVTRQGRRALSHVQSSEASTMPFLPRLEHGRLILTPASWRISARSRQSLLASGPDGFEPALGAWRRTWTVPDLVYLSVADNRLLLDLTAAGHRRQLWRVLRAATHSVVLQESIPGPEHAWLRGPDGAHIPELVVPLLQRNSRAPRTPVTPATPAGTLAARTRVYHPGERVKLPGSDWLHLRLNTRTEDQNRILTTHVDGFAELALASGMAQDWFFIRYADPVPHLRLRFHGDPQVLTEELLPDLVRWANELVECRDVARFAIEPYEREIERYGGVDGLAACERLFGIDSRWVIGLLGGEMSSSDPTVLAVRSISAFLEAISADADQRDSIYRRLVHDRRVSGPEYRRRRHELGSAVADGGPTSGRADAGNPDRWRQAQLAGPGDQLAALNRSGRLTRAADAVLASLVHMHLNRLLGPAGVEEQRLLGLAFRASQERWHRSRIT